MASRKASRPIDECLNEDVIDIAELRRIASLGIVDQGSHRGVAWRVLLGYLPLQRSEWDEVLKEKRALYQTLVHQVFSQTEETNGNELRGGKRAAAQHRKLQRQEEERRKQQDVTGEECTEQQDENVEQENATPDGQDENAEGSTTKDAQDESANMDEMKDQITELDDTGSAECVPARIREQWKKSGRDSSVLEEMSNGGVNTLLVVEGKAQDEWEHFFENAALLDEIRKDVVRTHPDLQFFLEPDQNLGQRRYAAIERILFVWAKLNKGVRYVQGMNEIVGTMYFVLANDFNEEWACEAEADTYFLFNTLMDEMRDVFVPALDDADTGIQGRISNMNALLGLHDPEVSSHLEDCGIHASFYAIRWLTTLLSREFLVPDTIRLWDSMFASTHKDNFLRYVCVTMVMLIRKELLRGDFSACLRLLQSYPPVPNLDALLESSRALWIYESQVTLACHKGGISLSQALTTISPPPSVVMAYGLPGGLAVRRRPAADSEAEVFPAVPGRALFNGAKDFLGGLGREVAMNMQARRSNSGSGKPT